MGGEQRIDDGPWMKKGEKRNRWVEGRKKKEEEDAGKFQKATRAEICEDNCGRVSRILVGMRKWLP